MIAGQITWEHFITRNNDAHGVRYKFEDLCRQLFTYEFLSQNNVNKYVHSNPNNPGIESEPILDEVNKGATMGMDAISYVSEKVKDNDFKEVLNVEYNKYQDISNRVNDLYNNYSNKEPHETNTMTKMMTWYGIQMKTMTDDSTSKLSELLMQGTNMGIIEGRRLLNQNQDADKDVKNILNDFVVMQEDSVETLKKYL